MIFFDQLKLVNDILPEVKEGEMMVAENREWAYDPRSGNIYFSV